MPTTITCPGCARPLNVPDTAIGGPAHCPHCLANFRVPRLADGTAGPPELPRRRWAIPAAVAAPALAILAVNLFALVVNGATLALALGKPAGDLDQTRQWVRQLRDSEMFEQSKDAAREKSKRDAARPKAERGAPEPEPPPPDPAEVERRREQDEALARAWAPLVRPLSAWSLAMSVVAALGGASLLRGRGYWLACAGAAASLLNVNNLCCVPGGIAAVWAGLVLIRDDGRAWFGRG